MMRTFCVFVLKCFSLLDIRLYNKNVTCLPRFLPFYVSFTVILWNIFPLLTLFCVHVCLFSFSLSLPMPDTFSPNVFITTLSLNKKFTIHRMILLKIAQPDSFTLKVSSNRKTTTQMRKMR